MTRSILVGIAFFMAVSAGAQVQVQKGFSVPPLGEDTLCFRYMFEAGDTVVYQIESADSVAFLGEPPLVKKRVETVQIICDSVRENGDYILRFTMTSAYEQNIFDGDTTERNTSPWVGRTSYLLTDSLGSRNAVMADNPNAAALSPGGAFQPLILPTLGESCGVQNQSWIVEDTTVLVENGVPEAVYSHQTLWRVIDKVDTLGQNYNQIQYTQTGIGSMSMKSNSTAFDLFAVIAGYGKLSFLEDIGVPYHVFATSHDRVEITSPGGSVRKGTHKLASHMRLREIRAKNTSRSFKVTD